MQETINGLNVTLLDSYNSDLGYEDREEEARDALNAILRAEAEAFPTLQTPVDEDSDEDSEDVVFQALLDAEERQELWEQHAKSVADKAVPTLLDDAPLYRAYDTSTEWSGPVHADADLAAADAAAHNEGCAEQGGYGSAIVVRRTDDDRLEDLDGEPVWPPYGRGCGAAHWRGKYA